MASGRKLSKLALGSILVVLAAGPASGDIQSGCIQDDRIAAGLAPFSGNFCTANDLTFVLIGLGIQKDGCLSTADTSEILDLRGIIENTGASTRYDAGLWISMRGDQTRCILSGELCTVDADCSGGGNTCNSTARWGPCSREFLIDPGYVSPTPVQPPPGPACAVATGGVDLTCGLGPYINDDADGCGDVRKFGSNGPPDCGQTVDLRLDPTDALCNVPTGGATVAEQDQTIVDYTSPVILPCVDRDGDGFMEIPTCTSWGQNAADISCPSKLCTGGPRAGLQCVLTADCGLGGICTAPACNICSGGTIPGGTPISCASDTDCPGGASTFQTCAGTCSVNGARCTDVDPFTCPPGQTCDNKLCKGSGDGCATAANCPGGGVGPGYQLCTASTDPICRTELAVPGTSAKCNCVDGLNSNVPVADLALSCSCTAPTTVRPGFPVACAVTYNNPTPALCTPNLADPERFRCGSTGYLRFDLDDGILPGPANGSFAVNSVTDGGTTGGTPAVINWTPNSSGANLGVVNAGRTGTLNLTYTVGLGASDGPITITTTSLFDNKHCTISGAICELDAQCPVGQTCDLDFSAAIAQAVTTTCNLNVDATFASVTAFTAHDDGGRVVVGWETAAEVGTAGFDLLRRGPRSREYERVNERLLPAAQHSPGGVYRFVDETAEPREELTYMVVEVNLEGRRQAHGPFRVHPASRPSRARIDGLEQGFSGRARQAPREVRQRLAKARAAEKARPARASRPSARLSTRTKLSATKSPKGAKVAAAAKVAVVETGLYVVGAAEIATALELPGATVDSLIRSRRLELSHRGRQVSWHAARDRSGIVFFGQAIDSPFTKQNVYRLTIGKGRGMRAAHGRRPPPVAGPASFERLAHLEKDLLPRVEVALGPDDDYWFWEVFVGSDPTHGTKTVAIEVPGVAPTTAAATLTVGLRALTDTPGDMGSRAEISLNGHSLGGFVREGPGDHTVEFSFAQGLLNDGPNLVEIAAETGIFLVDSFDLAYRRLYRAESDVLRLRGDGHSTVTVSGFSGPDLAVYDLTDPLAPMRVGAVTVDRGPDGLYRASFDPASPDTPYLAVGAAGRRSAPSVWPDRPSNLLAPTNRGEYLVIAGGPLVPAAQALADYRRSTGLESLVVELEDVYDELNHGIASPEAVRRFLTAAFGRWELPPRLVALAGKGSFDYRDNLGLGGNLVPPLMAMTSFGLVSSDNRFGDVLGDDGVPEIAVGRLPVVSSAELEAYLDKIEAFEDTTGQAWRRRILMVADDADTAGEFATDSDHLATLLPQTLAIDRLYLDQPWTVDETREGILGAINEGVLFVNYVGHGGLDRFAHEGVLRSSDVPALANGERLPMIAALTCNIGFFAFPGFTSLGEELVLREGGGAAAVWAPSGLSFNSHAVELGGKALHRLLISGDRTIGDLILRALREFAAGGGNPDSLTIFNLLGDPAGVVE